MLRVRVQGTQTVSSLGFLCKELGFVIKVCRHLVFGYLDPENLYIIKAFVNISGGLAVRRRAGAKWALALGVADVLRICAVRIATGHGTGWSAGGSTCPKDFLPAPCMGP